MMRYISQIKKCRYKEMMLTRCLDFYFSFVLNFIIYIVIIFFLLCFNVKS